jgi:SEL1 protein
VNGANGAIRLTAETSTGFDGAARRDADVAQYYKYSADMGNADAASAVGRLLTFGSRGVKQDARTAYKYFTQAAAAGDADAMAHLGHMFANGIGVNEPSNETALALFRAAVDKGNARAAYGLGYMHLGGFGVDRDLTKAFEHITNAAEAGSPEAQFHLGALYARGVFGKDAPKEENAEKESENAYARPSKRDHAKAFYNFNLAAAQGHATATYNLAIMQLSGSLGLPQTCKAAALLLKGLAERGAWTAGVEEARGALAAGRKRAGLVKYMKVAEAGVEVAQANAAFVLDRAEPWYEESTDDDDDDDARIRRRGFENKGRFSSVLGASTFGSSASASDRERRALHYHKLAADQGNVLSLLKIGDAYFYGRTGGKAPSDRSKFSTRDGEKRKVLNALDERRNVSAAVYLRATQRRSAQAMFNLGAMHEHGLGLPKDLHLAKRYYDMALSTDPKAYVPVKLALYKLQAHAWLLEKSKQSRFAAFLVRLVADVVELVSPSSSLSAETRVDGRFSFSANTNEEQSMDAPKHGSEYDVMALAVLTTALLVVVVARLFVDAGVLRVARAEAVLDGAEDATS